MRREGESLILESRPCHYCQGTGTGGPRQDPCPTCKGTGRGVRGGKGRCRACSGLRYQWARDDSLPCSHCKGARLIPESRFDSMPAALLASIPFRLYLRTGELTWNEAHLGLGCLWSCEDYGRTWDKLAAAARVSPEAYLAARDAFLSGLQADGSCQAVKVTTESGTFCREVAVVLNRGGYSLRAVFGDIAEVEAAVAGEPGQEEGRALGAAVYHAGGHGTLAAAGYEPAPGMPGRLSR